MFWFHRLPWFKLCLACRRRYFSSTEFLFLLFNLYSAKQLSGGPKVVGWCREEKVDDASNFSHEPHGICATFPEIAYSYLIWSNSINRRTRFESHSFKNCFVGNRLPIEVYILSFLRRKCSLKSFLYQATCTNTFHSNVLKLTFF